jgi:hypothetical protein
MIHSPLHKFHIPVMGLAYTIDTPVKVARFGISSVISIVESRLIEMMRKHYYPTMGWEYQPISTHEDDFRAKRITDYLNLVNTIVQAQVEKIRNAAFETGSEIVKYFEMLPDDSKLKHFYLQMMQAGDVRNKKRMEAYLRNQIHAGSIDVNIMTKTDRNNFNKAGELIENGSDAVAALRGYANSELSNSSVIFSAGTNLRLYNYLENCVGFDANTDGGFTKKVVIKVSDYRSAFIQGKYLAKKGIWVSEFRIESGLNCGGHAFATDGFLLGPILEEFKTKKQELIDTIFGLYNKALEQKTKRKFIYPPELSITVQGGIGTHEEDDFLHQYYNIESTGWGTPFLLVPEATTVDEETLKLLCAAKEKDLVLSQHSPFGVRFHYLKGTSADKERQARIVSGKPGSPCTEKHLAFNTEFTKEPICTASRKYQKLKIAQLQSLNLPEPVYQKQLTEVLDKECLCIGLSNAAAITYSHTMIKNLNAVNICPGPNIVNFSNVVSLQQMVDHIYGRKDILINPERPHMFITELSLYIRFLKEKLEEGFNTDQLISMQKYFVNFYQNLRNGISYYYKLPCLSHHTNEQFMQELSNAELELELLNFQYPFINQNEKN